MADNMAENKYSEDLPEDASNRTTIFAVRTTIGQEKGVLQLLYNRLFTINPFPDVKAMLISEQLRGYVFVEATHQRDVLLLIAGIRHVKGKVVGSIKLDSIGHVISPRRVTEVLEEGDQVEIVSGIFQGQKALVTRMPKEGAREEVTLRLIGSDSAISIKIHGDFLKLVQKGDKHQELYVLNANETPVKKEGPDVTAVPIMNEPVLTDIGKSLSLEAFDEDEEETEDSIEQEINRPSSTTKAESKKKVEKDDEEEDDEWSKFSF
jgi:transcription elongation factor Spt5